MNPRSTLSSPILALQCKALLWILPVLMIYGHIRAIGAVWNHATRATFNPLTNYVSDYAYRSPAWWAIVACVYGFAFFFGYLSWQAMSRPRTVLSWLVAAAAAIVMFKMGEVAIFPVKSPEVTIERLQQELNKGPMDKVKDGVWRTTLEVTGHRVPPNMTAEQFIKTHQSDRMHLGGIGPAWFLILVTMFGSFFLWYRHAASTRRWWLMHGAIAGLLCLATLGVSWKPEWIGLFQRLSFLAVYVWMWTVFLADQREPAEASDTKFGHRVLTGI